MDHALRADCQNKLTDTKLRRLCRLFLLQNLIRKEIKSKRLKNIDAVIYL